MRKYLPTIILGTTLFIGEVHTFWEHGSEKKVNWVINKSEPMTVQWNVKFLCDEINGILYFIAFLLYGAYPNKTNRTTVISFLILAFADMGIYFWNFKTVNYYYVYLAFVFVWILIFKLTNPPPRK